MIAAIMSSTMAQSIMRAMIRLPIRATEPIPCLGKPKRGLDIRVEGLLGLFNDAGQVANSKIQWSLVRRLKLIETNDGLRSSEVARFFEHLAHHGLNE